MKRVLLLVALLLAFACAFAAQGDEGEIGGVGGGPKITVEPFPSPLDSDDGDDEADDDETAFLQEDGDDSSDDADADSTADSSDADDNNEEIVAEKDEDKPAEEAESKQEDAAAAPAAEQKQEDAAAPAADAATPAVDSDAEPADDMAANGVTRAELADVDELNDEEHEGAAIPNADAPTLLKADGTEMSSFLMTEEEFREPPLPKHSYMDSTDNNAFNMPGLDPSQPSDESALIDLAVPRNAEEAEENDAYRYLSPDEKQVIEEELHDAHFNIIPKLLHERSLQQAKLDAQF